MLIMLCCRLLPRQTEESPDSDCSALVQGSIQGSSIVCERKAERPGLHCEHSSGRSQSVLDSIQPPNHGMFTDDPK